MPVTDGVPHVLAIYVTSGGRIVTVVADPVATVNPFGISSQTVDIVITFPTSPLLP